MVPCGSALLRSTPQCIIQVIHVVSVRCKSKGTHQGRKKLTGESSTIFHRFFDRAIRKRIVSRRIRTSPGALIKVSWRIQSTVPEYSSPSGSQPLTAIEEAMSACLARATTLASISEYAEKRFRSKYPRNRAAFLACRARLASCTVRVIAGPSGCTVWAGVRRAANGSSSRNAPSHIQKREPGRAAASGPRLQPGGTEAATEHHAIPTPPRCLGSPSRPQVMLKSGSPR